MTMRGWENYRPPSLSETETREKRSKYGNVKTMIDNVTFDSAREAKRYTELKMLQAAGKIRNLELQPVFKLQVGRVNLGVYRADFRYERFVWPGESKECETVVEDVKGVRTPVYRLKKRLMLACHGIEIRET